MLKLISCEFDIDTACVELRFTENVSLSIDCDVVERQYAHTVQQRCDLDYLVYNVPLEYARLVLRGKATDYLSIKKPPGHHQRWQAGGAGIIGRNTDNFRSCDVATKAF